MTLARIKSLLLTAPTSTPSSSTTSTLVMRCASIMSAASTASRSAPIVRGLARITSAAVSSRRSTPFSISRRRSPSVKMPTTRRASSTIAVAPRPLALISRIISVNGVSLLTLGTASP